jgi:hypothetical protein
MISKTLVAASMLLSTTDANVGATIKASRNTVYLKETRESPETFKTLITDEVNEDIVNKATLSYSYKTILQIFSDQSSISWLEATLTLKDLNTKYLSSETSDTTDGSVVRMSVGWRNP